MKMQPGIYIPNGQRCLGGLDITSFKEPPKEVLVWRDIGIPGIAFYVRVKLAYARGNFFEANLDACIACLCLQVRGRLHELTSA